MKDMLSVSPEEGILLNGCSDGEVIFTDPLMQPNHKEKLSIAKELRKAT